MSTIIAKRHWKLNKMLITTTILLFSVLNTVARTNASIVDNLPSKSYNEPSLSSDLIAEGTDIEDGGSFDARKIQSAYESRNNRQRKTTAEGTEQKEDEEDEEEIYYRKTNRPLFEVLLVAVSVSFFTLVGMLFVVPHISTRTEWHWSNSIFWLPTMLCKDDGRGTLDTSRDSSEQQEDLSDERQKRKQLLFDLFVPSVACGVTLATVVFLITPESILLIQHAQKNSSLTDGKASPEGFSNPVARYATLLILGYMLPQLLSGLFPRLYEYGGIYDNVNKEENLAESQEGTYFTFTCFQMFWCNLHHSFSFHNVFLEKSRFEDNVMDKSSTFTSDSRQSKHATYQIWNIIPRDAAINFFHGIFMGTAFMTCSNAMAVCVTIIVGFQRVTHEGVTYILLTEYVGLWFSNALLFNVYTGLVCILGSMVILYGGFYGSCVGMVLAFGGGYFLHTATHFYMMRIYSLVKLNLRHKVYAMLFFLIGAAAVGLATIGPKTCAQVRITSKYH